MKVIRRLWERHPNLVSWALLAAGMVIIVVLAARSVGFTAGQWAALIAATIGLAGLCVWILSWEDNDEEIDMEAGAKMSAEAAPAEKRQPAAPSMRESGSSGKRS